MKKYNIVITKINEDGTREQLADETLKNVMLLGECGDHDDTGRSCEILMGINMLEMSSLIAASKETYKAAKIGCLMRDIQKNSGPKIEDELIDRILGGDQ